ncbi:MAG: T9SS type A sorting domain-containing protein, partial [Bacteroidota bacterium]
AVPEVLFPTIFQDTLGCGNQLVTFTAGSDVWGFLSGTNGFTDLEKAQRFDYDGNNYQVLEVDVFFDFVSIVNDGDIFAKVYEIDAETGGPGELVGVSNAVKMSGVAVDDEFIVPTVFSFSQIPVVQGEQFFVSVDISDLYNTNDTLTIAMTDEDCGVAGETWELFGDGQTWADYSSEASWGIPSNILIVAVVEADGLSSTKDLLVGGERIRLHDAYPNPAKDELIIDFELEMSTVVQIEIYNLDGQLIQQIDNNKLPAGKYQERISTADLAAGTYFYGITTEKGRLMNKFVVGK